MGRIRWRDMEEGMGGINGDGHGDLTWVVNTHYSVPMICCGIVHPKAV